MASKTSDSLPVTRRSMAVTSREKEKGEGVASHGERGREKTSKGSAIDKLSKVWGKQNTRTKDGQGNSTGDLLLGWEGARRGGNELR